MYKTQHIKVSREVRNKRVNGTLGQIPRRLLEVVAFEIVFEGQGKVEPVEM